jgi:GT2 family glycosyltransferase
MPADPGGGVARSPKPGGIVFSAVICTYERYGLLPEAIASVLKQDAPAGSFEVIVVDNSPDQQGARRFATRYADTPGVTYLLEPKPGLSNARNVGITAARGRIVAFIDDDARALPSWTSELVTAHRFYGGRAGVVGGRVVPRWLGPPPSWLGPKLHGYLSVLDLGPNLRELSAGEWLLGCNISFDTAALISAGGFASALGRIGPEATLLSNDDIEACERIRKTGKIAAYAPNAVVEHLVDPRRLTQDWFRRRAAWQAVSDLLARPEQAPVLAAKAARQLSETGLRWKPPDRFRDSDNAAELHRDMIALYSTVVVALCGGEQPDTPSARTGIAAFSLRRLQTMLRSTSRSGKVDPRKLDDA